MRPWLLLVLGVGVVLLAWLAWPRREVERASLREPINGSPERPERPPADEREDEAHSPADAQAPSWTRVAWRLSGRVEDPDGQPVPGARVRAVWVRERYYEDVGYRTRIVDEAKTDTAGGFTIDHGPDPEATSLVVDAAGFAQGTWSVLDYHVRDDLVPRLPLTRAHGRVEGRVAGAGAGVEVAYAFADHGSGGNARTDAQGGFVIDGAPEGEVRIGAAPPGFAPATDRLLVREGCTATLILTLKRGRRVRGRTVPGASVWTSAWPRRRVVADEGGEFEVQGYEDGSFIIVEAAGYQRLLIEPDEDKEWVDARLKPGASVAGVVVDRNGRPLHHARVVALTLDDPTPTLSTGPDGSFRFDFLTTEEVEFSLWITAPGYANVEIDVRIAGAGEVDAGTITLR